MPNLYPFLSLRLELVESGHPPVMTFPGGNTTASSASNWLRKLTLTGSGYAHKKWLIFNRALWPDDTVFAVVRDKQLQAMMTAEECAFWITESIQRDAVCGAMARGNTLDDLLAVCQSPLNTVHITADPVANVIGYSIARKLVGGEYTIIAEADEVDHYDGPLVDGSYVYRVTAYDKWGNAADSEEVPITITTEPLPVTDLAFSYTGNTVTITWTASTSSDIDHYAIYLSGDDGILEFDGTITDTTGNLTWDYIFSPGTTGTFAIMVRAVDSGGRMERGIFNVVYLSLDTGAEDNLPNNPYDIAAWFLPYPSRVRVRFFYDARDEIGRAIEARIYSNGGAGAIDWNTPVDTLRIRYVEEPTEYTWTSDTLGNGTYKVAVRLATDVWPDGFETDNIDEYEVVVSAVSPGDPDADGEIV